jgi:FlaA1/EpsC-like NDP-sugar epimerase
MLAADICLIGCAYFLAYVLRFEGEIPAPFFEIFLKTIFMVILVKIGFFIFFDLYRGMWRYTSIIDFLNIVKASVASSIGLIFAVFFFFNFLRFSRSVFILDFILTLIFIGGLRVAIRILFSGKDPSLFSLLEPKKKGKKRDVKNLLLIGAGNTGEHVLREMMSDRNANLKAVGFLDDNHQKLGSSIHGVPVLGHIDQIDQVDVDFDEILITSPSATGVQMQRIVAACKRSGKPFKTVPLIGELIGGRISLKLVREVTIADLVERDEVSLDTRDIQKYLLGKKVLVTGAGGSIGSELVRQIIRCKPRAVALLDMSEYNLYQVEMECRERFSDYDSNSDQPAGSGLTQIMAFLVDLGNLHPTRHVFKTFQPDVVFHAAAYKHVPMQENNPWEAVYNNLQGTKNLIRCSMDFDVDKFILVSTDKAVRPTNIMGATKRICELLASSVKENGTTRFISVRFGNVMGSSGSVIPHFQQQIARGGPVTITHPDITRYFMSIPEAAQLILQAAVMGQGGEVFILKMGKPVRIVDLANEIIKLSGFEPDRKSVV